MKMNFKSQRGVILVFGLGLMAMLMALALVFSSLIFSDLKKVRLVGQSLIAYYAADAGLERSLFIIRKGSNNQDIEGADDLKNIAASGQLDASLAKWDISESISAESVVFRQRLKNGQGVKLYFLGRSDLPRTNLAESFTVEWNRAGGSLAKLQIAMTQLTPQTQSGGLAVNYTDTNILAFEDTVSRGSIQCFDFKDSAIGGGFLLSDYLAEIKVLGMSGDNVEQLIVKAYNSSCSGLNPESEPSPDAITNLTIRSVGVKNKVRQEVVAHLPPKAVASGLLNFVLFSEEDITKDY